MLREYLQLPQNDGPIDLNEFKMLELTTLLKISVTVLLYVGEVEIPLA